MKLVIKCNNEPTTQCNYNMYDNIKHLVTLPVISSIKVSSPREVSSTTGARRIATVGSRSERSLATTERATLPVSRPPRLQPPNRRCIAAQLDSQPPRLSTVLLA